MIDKNDVKMPVQRDVSQIDFSDGEVVKKIEELLDEVNAIESKQELRLNNGYYSRFNWFKASRNDKSYFSYQEEAVYDFIFNLNKSGILSDQVGMGKTIEAGMIISELASRKELKSLLIIVPNEIMAQKWKSELEEKFGIQQYSDPMRPEKVYPGVSTVKNYDDFCKHVYNCVTKSFKKFNEHVYEHKYEPGDKKETLAEVIKSYVYADINTAVELINDCCRTNRYDKVKVVFDGNQFRIEGTQFSRKYVYGQRGGVSRYLAQRGAQNSNPASAINNSRFAHNYFRNVLEEELFDLFVLLGDYFTTRPNVMAKVASSLKDDYPILVIPISYTEKEGDAYILKEFLNRTLANDSESYKHKYYKNGENVLSKENYRIIDFFIDVGYQTLIVDEVHDYIDVCAKIKRSSFSNPYPSETYDRYELFDDYYFIKKSSLYKKLKRLADKAVRKIFLTATPIKSDMVDFYLLTLIASNKDADSYNELSRSLENSYPIASERNAVIENLCGALVDAGIENAVHEYHINYGKYEAKAPDSNEQMYPYFTQYVRDNGNSEETLKKYLRGQVDYMTAEEIALELISAFYAEKKDSGKDLKDIVDLLEESLRSDGLLPQPMTREMITRIVFKSLLNNTVRMRFEEDFTIDGEHIKRIGDLLGLKDGPRRWFKTYRKYGIRHTRHQTYNLADCDRLDKIKNEQKKERFKNLPVWPKRNGRIIFLYRDDCFFDSFINVKRQLPADGKTDVAIDDLPNYDTLLGTPEEKAAHFEDAKAIFDYINGAMSGGRPGTYEPFSSNYESVNIDDSLMVEYKLALVDKLMSGSDKENLGAINKKVLLFAEAESRDEIIEWFRYQKCKPLYKGEELDPEKLKEYTAKWERDNVVDDIKTICANDRWKVSDVLEGNSLDDDGNLLVIIDPKRYEKGVDLQKADTIINFDINFDPLKMEQRIGRIDRIRPSGRSQEINIISFVPLNDMSGFVINFFANEMKMFTQWMGETTGIVSVDDGGDDEDGTGDVARGVSFESNVTSLDVLYRELYAVCMSREDLPPKTIEKYAEDISKSLKTDKEVTLSDLRYLHSMRKLFDEMFRNSITPQRQGYAVNGSDKRVIRFNSANTVFSPCDAEKCGGCPRKNRCKAGGGKVWNEFPLFCKAADKFFDKGEKFCNDELDAYAKRLGNVNLQSANSGDRALTNVLGARKKEFAETKKKVMAALEGLGGASATDCFTLPFDKFGEIFGPVKSLYWDNVAQLYVDKILDRFYSQCDNVLNSAKKFEKFIKTFSIAEFMNNLDERE